MFGLEEFTIKARTADLTVVQKTKVPESGGKPEESEIDDAWSCDDTSAAAVGLLCSRLPGCFRALLACLSRPALWGRILPPPAAGLAPARTAKNAKSWLNHRPSRLVIEACWSFTTPEIGQEPVASMPRRIRRRRSPNQVLLSIDASLYF